MKTIHTSTYRTHLSSRIHSCWMNNPKIVEFMKVAATTSIPLPLPLSSSFSVSLISSIFTSHAGVGLQHDHSIGAILLRSITGSDHSCGLQPQDILCVAGEDALFQTAWGCFKVPLTSFWCKSVILTFFS